MRRSSCLVLAFMLCGCDAFPLIGRHASLPAQRGENAAEDRDTTAALLLASTFQGMQRLVQSPPAEQAEILAAARATYTRSPQGAAQLRYALLLATPGHPGRDPALAQTLLRELAAQPETLVPVERAVTLVQLAQLDRELGLAADNDRLQNDALRTDRERIAAMQRRLLAESDENAKLRRQLEEAQAKLNAIADIERNLTDRKHRAEGPHQ